LEFLFQLSRTSSTPLAEPNGNFFVAVVCGAETQHCPALRKRKKAGVVEHPEVFDHAGLLVNGPPDMAGLPFA
jgi:hypothetical protein